MAEILCLATAFPQQGKLSFGYQDLVSGPQTALKRPKGQEDKDNIQKPSERLSGCNKAGKQALRAFCKAIRAL